jgi:hypothetical protein
VRACRYTAGVAKHAAAAAMAASEARTPNWDLQVVHPATTKPLTACAAFPGAGPAR